MGWSSGVGIAVSGLNSDVERKLLLRALVSRYLPA